MFPPSLGCCLTSLLALLLLLQSEATKCPIINGRCGQQQRRRQQRSEQQQQYQQPAFEADVSAAVAAVLLCSAACMLRSGSVSALRSQLISCC